MREQGGGDNERFKPNIVVRDKNGKRIVIVNAAVPFKNSNIVTNEVMEVSH
jgi:hypothetical protein